MYPSLGSQSRGDNFPGVRRSRRGRVAGLRRQAKGPVGQQRLAPILSGPLVGQTEGARLAPRLSVVHPVGRNQRKPAPPSGRILLLWGGTLQPL